MRQIEATDRQTAEDQRTIVEARCGAAEELRATGRAAPRGQWNSSSTLWRSCGARRKKRCCGVITGGGKPRSSDGR